MAAPELHETVAVGRGTSEGSAVGQGRSTDAGGFVLTYVGAKIISQKLPLKLR
jgi:hypothetical protein